MTRCSAVLLWVIAAGTCVARADEPRPRPIDTLRAAVDGLRIEPSVGARSPGVAMT